MLYALVLVIAALLGWMVYRYDLYDKEPVLLLLLAVGLGYLAMAGVGHLEDRTLVWLDDDRVATQAAVAASHEELARLLIVAAIALVFRRHFNDPMDGLIYGAFVGLGMALEESKLYINTMAAAATSIVGTEAVRLVLHTLLAGLSGFGVGMAAMRTRLWPLAIALWLAGAMLLHFLWDLMLGIPLARGDADLPVDPRIASVAMMVVTLAAFAGSVILGNRWSRQAFAPHSRQRVWGWPFR